MAPIHCSVKRCLIPPVRSLTRLAQRDGVFGAVADPTLMARLELKPGARIAIGNANIEIRAALASEPDKLAGGIGFGPRLLVSQHALRATGLLQPGSLVRWHYRLRLPANDASDAAAKAVSAQARTQLPEAGWDIRSRSNASPQLERNVERFTQFLTIVGLTALLVGGVGVGNAVKSHLDRRRETIATMKALGASGRRIFAIYLTQVLLLALIGGAIGVAFGAVLPFVVIVDIWRHYSVADRARIASAELVLALIYGLLTALVFALWPLGRAHDVPVANCSATWWRRSRGGRASAMLRSPAIADRCSGRARCPARLRPPCRDHLCRTPPPACFVLLRCRRRQY